MFFQKARIGFNNWWRYLAAIFAVFIGYNVGQLPLFLAINREISENPDVDTEVLQEFMANPDFSLVNINPNMGFTLLLLMFVGALTAFFFIFKPLHQREFRSLITPSSRINWNKIFFGFGLWLALSLCVELVAYFMDPGHYIFKFKFNTFIPLVLISLLILPIQTSTEELLFRGYLMQGFGNAKWLKISGKNYKFVPLIITSVLFGLIHSMNPEIKEFGFGIMQSYYVSAGLVLGIMTIMDDGLELALGVHAATNFTGAVFVGYEGAAIQTDSLFLTTELNPHLMLIGFIFISILFLLICKNKYKWSSFNKLYSEIEDPPEIV
jgi:membrane protease YdiL (CAAX protease family)